jgi:hypothetical protein
MMDELELNLDKTAYDYYDARYRQLIVAMDDYFQRGYALSQVVTYLTRLAPPLGRPFLTRAITHAYKLGQELTRETN